MAIGTYISIFTLNVIGLNTPIKRHRLAEWIQKQDPYICCLKVTHFRPKTHIDWNWEDGKIYSMQTGSNIKLVASDKIDLKIKKIKNTRKDTI